MEKIEIEASSILYEDEWLIAVFKPTGLPTQATVDTKRDHLYAAVSRFLKKRDPGAYLGLHHRLDLDTTGVVLMTKSRAANPGISALFKNRQIRKTYEALCETGAAQSVKLKDGVAVELVSGSEWRIHNYLSRKVGADKKPRMVSVSSGGDVAITDFRILSQKGARIFVECHPLTGRTHQIRVHLAEIGLPIVGDVLYGSSNHSERLLLHARSLEFIHPITHKNIRIEAENRFRL